MSFYAAAVMSIQIEIAMVGQVQNGSPVTDAVIMKLQRIILIQGVGYACFPVSGKSQIAVCVLQRKSDTAVGYGCFPQTLVPSPFFMTVQIVGAVVYIQLPDLSIQFKGRASCPVGIGPITAPKKLGFFR